MMLLKSSDPPEANITLAKFSYACMSFKSWEVLKTMTHCIIRCLLHKSQLIVDQCSHFLLARYYFFLQNGTYVSAIKFVIACGKIYDHIWRLNFRLLVPKYMRERVTWDVKAPVLSFMFGFSVSSSLWGSRARMGIVLLTLVLEKWTGFSTKNLIVLVFFAVGTKWRYWDIE